MSEEAEPAEEDGRDAEPAEEDGQEAEPARTSGPVDVDVTIEAGRTLVTVEGQRDAAVVVYSASGERIYLPPEEAVAGNEVGPYRPVESTKSPYDPGEGGASPYDPSRRADPSIGMNATGDGFRILHPEPVTDLRLLR